MGKYINALGRAAKAFAEANGPEEPQKFAVVGKDVSCSHCENTEFVRIAVNLGIFSNLELPGVDRIPSVLVCSNCKKFEIFGKKPEVKKPEVEKPEVVE